MKNLFGTALVAVSAIIVSAGPALASIPPGASLPAPGVLGLVAAGVVGAIVVAKLRK